MRSGRSPNSTGTSLSTDLIIPNCIQVVMLQTSEVSKTSEVSPEPEFPVVHNDR